MREAGKGNVQTKTIEADFSAPTAALFKKIEAELSGLDIAILVSDLSSASFCFGGHALQQLAFWTNSPHR